MKELIAQHVPLLEDFVLKILKLLKDTIDKVPFGIRWLCKATWSLVHEKFPDTQPDTLNALIGGFFFLRYINPIIATPHGKGGTGGLRYSQPPHRGVRFSSDTSTQS